MKPKQWSETPPDTFFKYLLRCAAVVVGLVFEIEHKIGGAYQHWRIGITADPVERYKQHIRDGRDCDQWLHWWVGSLWTAQQVESQLISKGMQGGTGGNIQGHGPICIYIFRAT